MASIKDHIVFITGASAGIGAASARAFADAGAHLILAARRGERVLALAEQLHAEFGVDALPLELDVRDQAAVAQTIGSLPERWAPIDILLNNAGLSRGLDKLHEGTLQDWDEMIDTNIKGLLYVSRAVTPGMVARGRGHIINIGSIAGHETYPRGNVYCATKAAVVTLSKGLRLDLVGTGIRVTCVDPGMVETEFSLVRFRGDAARADKVYQGFQPLTAADIAETVVWCATRPPHVNVEDIVIFPTAQASATLTHRT